MSPVLEQRHNRATSSSSNYWAVQQPASVGRAAGVGQTLTVDRFLAGGSPSRAKMQKLCGAFPLLHLSMCSTGVQRNTGAGRRCSSCCPTTPARTPHGPAGNRRCPRASLGHTPHSFTSHSTFLIPRQRSTPLFLLIPPGDLCPGHMSYRQGGRGGQGGYYGPPDDRGDPDYYQGTSRGGRGNQGWRGAPAGGGRGRGWGYNDRYNDGGWQGGGRDGRGGGYSGGGGHYEERGGRGGPRGGRGGGYYDDGGRGGGGGGRGYYDDGSYRGGSSGGRSRGRGRYNWGGRERPGRCGLRRQSKGHVLFTGAGAEHTGAHTCNGSSARCHSHMLPCPAKRPRAPPVALHARGSAHYPAKPTPLSRSPPRRRPSWRPLSAAAEGFAARRCNGADGAEAAHQASDVHLRRHRKPAAVHGRAGRPRVCLELRVRAGAGMRGTLGQRSGRSSAPMYSRAGPRLAGLLTNAPPCLPASQPACLPD
jgi:hypothetical protein